MYELHLFQKIGDTRAQSGFVKTGSKNRDPGSGDQILSGSQKTPLRQISGAVIGFHVTNQAKIIYLFFELAIAL
jgi:hypothetical protein